MAENTENPTPDNDELPLDELQVLLADSLIHTRDLIRRIADAGGIAPNAAPSNLANFDEFEKDLSKIPDLQTAEGSETVKRARMAIRAAGREIGLVEWAEAAINEIATATGIAL